MNNFKVGDWVRNLNGDIFKLEDIHIWQDLHSLFTPWRPKVGEWVLISTVISDYKYELVRVGTILDEYTISPYEFPNEVISLSMVQPFLGTPPFIEED